jgi:tryptophanyl-tRNA synthetase
MSGNLIKALEPIRDKRHYYEGRPELVEEIMHTGSDRARDVARATMAEVRGAVKI